MGHPWVGINGVLPLCGYFVGNQGLVKQSKEQKIKLAQVIWIVSKDKSIVFID